MTATFVSIALVVLIMFVLVYTAMKSNRARETWATVDGRVVESRVEVRSRPGAERSDDVQYGAVVVYEYTVAGKQLRSGRVSFEGIAWRADRDAAEADRARYAEGAKISVFYDPGKPENAVLDLPAR
jgi:hypothetical protein